MFCFKSSLELYTKFCCSKKNDTNLLNQYQPRILKYLFIPAGKVFQHYTNKQSILKQIHPKNASIPIMKYIMRKKPCLTKI